MTWSERRDLLKTTILEFFKGGSFFHGAALAYYTLLALVPILYLSITYFGMIVGNDIMIDIISSLLKDSVGIKDASGILEFLNEIDFQKGSILLQTLGIVALMFSCTAILNSLKRSLNAFYDIEKQSIGHKKKILRGVLSRLISMAFVIGITILLILLYFAQTVFLSLSSSLLEDMTLLNKAFSTLVQHGVPILLNLIVFSFVFKYIHDGRVEWRMAIRGALLTSVMLYLGQLLIKYYLANYFFAADGGVAGTMLIILVWVYYSSQIIFFGAKFLTVLSRMNGVPITFRD